MTACLVGTRATTQVCRDEETAASRVNEPSIGNSIPAPGFQEVTWEDLEEPMQVGNTNDVEDLPEDEEGGDAASNAGETNQRKVTTQKLSLLLGVCTSLQEMIQDIES
ncbi:hypothetical protein Hamer_G003672 [Homarus americanus]|uniref:Uncharacterized protein n=1 Tax=Homarus americanus TaxID=6706 RepID=A0A8J5MU43_HOMAM|nr:hypothetical protein Hamer_G003672 [Homarus americanus]